MAGLIRARDSKRSSSVENSASCYSQTLRTTVALQKNTMNAVIHNHIAAARGHNVRYTYLSINPLIC